MAKINVEKANKTYVIIFFAILTLGIIWNFFPQPHWPDWPAYVFWASLVFALVLHIFTSQKEKSSEQERKVISFYWSVSLLILITLLSIFSGEPSSGYKFFDPIISIVLIPILYMDWKKIRGK